MVIALSVIHLLIALVLIVIVLLQSGKGSDIGAPLAAARARPSSVGAALRPS